MGEILRLIQEEPDWFDIDRHDRGLNGKRVSAALVDLQKGTGLKTAVLVEKTSRMRSGGSFYIADGMHGLVAYGLYSRGSPGMFPVPAVLGFSTDV